MDNKQQEALRYIYHGIYLQVFVGLGYFLSGLSGVDIPDNFNKPTTIGMLIIILSLNSLRYISRYKKSINKTKAPEGDSGGSGSCLL